MKRQLATVSIALGDPRLLGTFKKQKEKRSLHPVLLMLVLKSCVVARTIEFFRSTVCLSYVVIS